MMDTERYRELAGLVARTWNTLAKENGWPKRVDETQVFHMRTLITNVGKGISRIGESTRREDTLVRWVLSRWNWGKSPAPLSQAGAPRLWETLKDSLEREAEEAAIDIDRQLEEVTEWVKFRFDNILSDGTTREQAVKRTESFAHYTGRFETWNSKEQARFQEEIKKLANPT